MAHAGRLETGSQRQDSAQNDGSGIWNRRVTRRAVLGGTVAAVGAGVVGVAFGDKLFGSGSAEPKSQTAANTNTNVVAGGQARPEATTAAKAEAASKLEKAPDFKLQSVDGQKIQLSDYLGKPVVIYYWGEGDSIGERALEDFDKTISTVKNSSVKDLVLLTIVLDGRNGGGKIKGKTSPILQDDYDVTIDTAGNKNQYPVTLKSLRLTGYPSTVFVTRNGEIMSRYFGPIEPSVLESKIKALDAIKQ